MLPPRKRLRSDSGVIAGTGDPLKSRTLRVTITCAPQAIAAERVNAVREACRAAGQACEAHTIEAVHPWEAIIEHAKTHACDLIVMSSHGRKGVTALLLGSETQKVLTHTSIPVLVVR